MEKMMTQATITKMVKDRGFGFAKDADDQVYFFHYSSIDPKSKLVFDNLNEGASIEFTSMDAEKGPRAAPRSLRLVS